MFHSDGHPTTLLLVIKDLAVNYSNIFKTYVTRGSHHRNLSVIYIVQNLFHQGKGSRSISLNSHYLVFFKNPRDKLQILTLAKQMYPGQTDFFLNQYEEAVKRPFGYLLIDLKTTTQDNCRLRTSILTVKKALTKQGSSKYSSRASKISEAANYFACPASSSYGRNNQHCSTLNIKDTRFFNSNDSILNSPQTPST